MVKNNTYKVTVPAKIHLLGEHTVVYGKPAILASVDLRLSATVSEINESVIEIVYANGNTKTDIHEIKKRSDIAKNLWHEFSASNDLKYLKKITQNDRDFIKICIGEALDYFNGWKNIKGLKIQIISDIPEGSGLGSSAALASAVAGSISLLLQKPLDLNEINDIAFKAERYQHGNPSGGDPATVVYGGLVWFRKEADNLRIIQKLPFDLPENIAEKFILIDTGKPVESTGGMVSAVRELKNRNPDKVNHILNDQESLVRQLLSVLPAGNAKEFIPIMREGEANLEFLGVVSDSVKKLIRKIETAEGAAKICGGGGIKMGTGIVLSFHENPDVVKDICRKLNYKCFQTKLGVRGIYE